MNEEKNETTLEELKKSVKEALIEEAEEYQDFCCNGELTHEIADEYTPIYDKAVLEVLNSDKSLMNFEADLDPKKLTVFELGKTVIYEELRRYAYAYIEDNPKKFNYLED